MSGAGSFQGLQFRILEVLEKQPRQAPLTALEIADILHSGEYRNEMKDNVVFKVSRAVHSMKEQGKIILSDARDKEGRLCYQLPTRLKFPPNVNDKPANPVLTPELAAKVKTVEPKPEPSGKGRQRPLYVPGVQQKIVEALNKSPHPMTTTDMAQQLGHLYGDNVPASRLSTLFSGSLHHLAVNKRTVFRRRVKEHGQGVMYEYYTRKTGTEPHPLSKKAAPKPQVVEAKPPAEQAPAPTPELDPRRYETHLTDRPSSGVFFRPQKPELRDIEMKFKAPAAWNNRLVEAAHTTGISVTEFIIQAVDFALDHLDA